MTSARQLTRVAWVESPLQFLNAVEWSAATGGRLNIALRAGTVQLAATAQAVAAHLPRTVHVVGEFSSAARSPFARSSLRLIGDPHSGQVCAVIASRGGLDTVLVDDGSVAPVAADQIARGAPLIRPGHRPQAYVRMMTARASRVLRSAANRHRLAAFTAYAQEPGLQRLAAAGAELSSNHYRWLRGLDLGAHQLPPTVILGSALVADGHVRPEAYLAWLENAAVGGAAYYPHRRESPELLAVFRSVPGLELRQATLPIELELSSATGLERLVTLPSSAVTTLRHILRHDLEMRVDDVPDSWWSENADPAWRRIIHEMSQGGKVDE